MSQGLPDSQIGRPKVGDEISYRSMGGCTTATVVGRNFSTLELDNGVDVPGHCVIEVLERGARHYRDLGKEAKRQGLE